MGSPYQVVKITAPYCTVYDYMYEYIVRAVNV